MATIYYMALFVMYTSEVSVVHGMSYVRNTYGIRTVRKGKLSACLGSAT